MRALILAAGAALTLSACGGPEEAAVEENNTMAVETLEVGNVIVNEGDAMNGLDANAMGTNGMTLDTNAMGTDLNMTGEAGANTTTNTL